MSIDFSASPEYIEQLYLSWKASPDQLPASWRAYFEGFELGSAGEPSAAERPGSAEHACKQSAVQSLIYRYRDIGHLLACTDPLSYCPTSHPLLDLEAFGLGSEDLGTVYHCGRFFNPRATLQEIIDTLQETYCRSIGVEYMQIQNPEERQWLMDRMEPVRNRPDFTLEEKTRILWKLMAATLFEQFLHKKFLGQKRFSLEGGESLIPLLDRLVQEAGRRQVKDIVLGMSHRGRLNVLSNIFGKPYGAIFAEYEDNLEHAFVGEGDVKYHKGFSTNIEVEGHKVHLSLAANPSHLELVNPVVEGKTRARQDAYGSGGKQQVLPILLHGDAAFSGQGIVPETLNLSQLEGYRTGGTIHVVINNQIGFTTLPSDSRSTRYATDVAKMLAVPIFHVHGDDPEALLFIADLALEYRQSFGRDVIIEIICYRRHGHNEGDEPNFTQPLMYETIRNHPPIHQLYADRLVEEGLPPEQVEAMVSGVNQCLELGLSGEEKTTDVGFLGKWQQIDRDYSRAGVDTAVDRQTLQRLAETLTRTPEGFSTHPKVLKMLENRRRTIEEGEGIDWGGAEALAFASLLNDGVSVRLSGQDSRRGTFNHRHAALVDTLTGETCIPLAHTAQQGASFQVYNSMLSEAGVLGFEYGYALETPFGLTLWEAQFGDFANGAQAVIDQFIASSATKWDRSNGLVMLLPHGFEGQGPEHSSARIERYLQLCADNNMQVVYPSTPAQFFHLLRRQMKQTFRRPLIVFTPKSLLRHPQCRSSLQELTDGRFEEILPDPLDPGRVRTLILCTGKVYYDLLQRREKDQRQDLALLRLEQLYPLHPDLLERTLAPYRQVKKVAWVQEEPQNAGAWTSIRAPLAEALGREPEYIGRDEAGSPAVGSHRTHLLEQQALADQAFA